MKKSLKLGLRILLFGVLTIVGLFIVLVVFLSLRYSPVYMYRELFTKGASPYDFRFLPERKLTASPNPYQFGVDLSKEILVQDAFQSNPKIKTLDPFLASTGTQAFLVIQNDKVIYERYFMGYQRESVVTSFSIAKSFDSAMIGIAIQEGFIKSADDPITNYLPELVQRDPRFKNIRIRDLLMMASGLRYDSGRPFGMGDGSLTYSFDDLRHLALTETEIVDPPGVNFLYNNFNPLLLGMILERATGKPVTTYLQEKIWTPLGMEFDGSWSLDSQKSGFEKMESGINACAIDFAKLGRLYLNSGNWDGNQIIPAEWVAQSIQDNGLIKDPSIFYGYMWWGERCNPNNQDFFAIGNFGQFVYVSPAKNMVIVRNGEKYGLKGELEEWAGIFCQFAAAMP